MLRLKLASRWVILLALGLNRVGKPVDVSSLSIIMSDVAFWNSRVFCTALAAVSGSDLLVPAVDSVSVQKFQQESVMCLICVIRIL